MTAASVEPSSQLWLSLSIQGPAVATSPGGPRKTHVDEQGSGQALGPHLAKQVSDLHTLPGSLLFTLASLT